MSQNTGEKQTNYLFFEAYLKTFASVLPTASQLPPKDTHRTPFPWALQIRHSWCWRVWVGSHDCFNLISERSLHCFSQWPCKQSGAFSKFQWHLRAGSYLWWQYRTKIFPRPAAHSGLHPPLGCVATTLWSGSQSRCSRKKILHLCQVIFREDQMPQPAHNMAPRTAVSPVGKGTGGSSQDEPVGGNCLGSRHHEKTNLELWVAQPLATLPPRLYSSPPWSLRQCHDPQHILASHVKKQSNISAM